MLYKYNISVRIQTSQPNRAGCARTHANSAASVAANVVAAAAANASPA